MLSSPKKTKRALLMLRNWRSAWSKLQSVATYQLQNILQNIPKDRHGELSTWSSASWTDSPTGLPRDDGKESRETLKWATVIHAANLLSLFER